MVISEWLRRRLPPAQRLEWYPPFRAMRVKVLVLENDWRDVRLLLPLARNRNLGGGMFGGAVACLADPVAALACARVFPGHEVWTRKLVLDFRHEARTDLELRFRFDAGQELDIGGELQRRGRATPTFEYSFFDTRERACVGVTCRVAIRPAGYRPGTGSHRSKSRDE